MEFSLIKFHLINSFDLKCTLKEILLLGANFKHRFFEANKINSIAKRCYNYHEIECFMPLDCWIKLAKIVS